MGKLVYYPTTNEFCGDTGGGGGGGSGVDSLNGISGAVQIQVDSPLTIRKEGKNIIIGINSTPGGDGIKTINGVSPDEKKDFKITAADPSKITPKANGIEVMANIKVETDSGTAISENSVLVDMGDKSQGVSTSSPG